MTLPKILPTEPFTPDEVAHITQVVFGTPDAPPSAEALFVFGGTHPGSWQVATELYRRLGPRLVFVSGGFKASRHSHATWTHGDANEADVIAQRLVEHGVPPEVIVKESRSTNSLENVTFLRDEILGRGIGSLVCVCKSFAVGRQTRTIRKHLPEVAIAVVGFDTDPEEGQVLTRDGWADTDHSRARIWAEYVRNCVYARSGDIAADFQPPPSLWKRLAALEKAMTGKP